MLSPMSLISNERHIMSTDGIRHGCTDTTRIDAEITHSLTPTLAHYLTHSLTHSINHSQTLIQLYIQLYIGLQMKSIGL